MSFVEIVNLRFYVHLDVKQHPTQIQRKKNERKVELYKKIAKRMVKSLKNIKDKNESILQKEQFKRSNI